MELNFNLYFAFDFLFYLILGISGLATPLQLLALLNTPPAVHRHEEIHEFIKATAILLSNTLAIVNITQAFSFLLALRGNDNTKRIVSSINAFLNIALASCFWYNIHYAHNPHNDITAHLLFVEQGISSIWFSNLWSLLDAVLLLYFGVIKKLLSNTKKMQ